MVNPWEIHGKSLVNPQILKLGSVVDFGKFEVGLFDFEGSPKLNLSTLIINHKHTNNKNIYAKIVEIHFLM